MPHQAGGGRDPGNEQDGSRREQKAEKPEQNFHSSRPAPLRPRPIQFAPRGAASAPYPIFCPQRPSNRPQDTRPRNLGSDPTGTPVSNRCENPRSVCVSSL